jgi:hypothetical protein
LNLRQEAFLKRLAKQGLTPAGYPQSPLDEMEEREKEEKKCWRRGSFYFLISRGSQACSPLIGPRYRSM